MKKIAAAKFKAECLQLMDVVQSTRQTVIITKRGKPIAKLVPLELEGPDDFLGRLEGKMKVVGDIMAPAFPLEEWESLR